LLPSLELLCRDLGVADGDLENVLALRLAYMRRALVPEADVLDALIALRQRGLRLGLITACSGDVPIVWDETPLVRSFDATVFSCDVGMCKPDPRIYRLAEDRLACPARDCLYVGDGGHDELAGAQHVGMTAVLLRRRGSSRPDPGGWTYTITSIPAVVSLLGDPR
jgi:putative hydrolase of the HAD superfamily